MKNKTGFDKQQNVQIGAYKKYYGTGGQVPVTPVYFFLGDRFIFLGIYVGHLQIVRRFKVGSFTWLSIASSVLILRVSILTAYES